MTTTAVRIGLVRAQPQSGATARLGGMARAATAFVALVVATVAAFTLAERLATSAALFVLAIAAETTIWLFGAVRTRRTIRLLAPILERADRAACADLNALLERESR